MLGVGFPAFWKASCGDRLANQYYLRLAEKNLSFAFDIAAVTRLENVLRHVCFERAFSPKEDNRMQFLVVNVQERCQSFCVPIVLVQGILKFVLFGVKNLRPLGLIFTAINPPTHIFRLNHKDSVARDDDMIDLGRSAIAGDRDVVELLVNAGVKFEAMHQHGLGFAKPAFERRNERHNSDRAIVVVSTKL